MKYLANLDLNKNQLQNAVIHPLSAAPTNPAIGQIYFNTTDGVIYSYTGSTWGPVGVVYQQEASTNAVICGLDDEGNVTTKKVIELTLGDYAGNNNYVKVNNSLETAFSVLDGKIKELFDKNPEENQNAWSYVNTTAQSTNTTTEVVGNGAAVDIAAGAKTDRFNIASGDAWTKVKGDSTSKTVTIGHKFSGVTAGTYGKDSTASDEAKISTVTVDVAGHVTAASETSITGSKYIRGLTSDAQTQISQKQATITGAASTVTESDLDNNVVVVTNNNGKIVSSAVTTTELGYLSGTTSAVQTQITGITGKIPSQATTENQLADKAFVNSSIQNMAANYVTYNADGDPFPTHAALSSATTFYHAGQVYTVTNNDYCIVTADETHKSGGVDPTARYIYAKAEGAASGSWQYQYNITSTFTAAQWASINSGATTESVEQITTNKTDIAANTTTMNTHIAATNNPHSVTKTQVGLGNVDNVKQWADSNHPTTVSGYGITDAKIDSGVITLGSNTITPLTKVNLNGTDSTSPVLYAPTTAGTNGQILKSNGSGAPTWTDAPEYFHKYTATNAQLTAEGGGWTWTIPAATHGVNNNSMCVSLYEVATGAQVFADVVINASTYAVTITIVDSTSVGTLTAGTYKVVIIG